MAFCKFSTEFIASSKTELDNIFISEYLPFAKGEYVKVYLYGLYLCSSTNPLGNNISSFAETLSMSESEVVEAFSYWAELGLVSILNIEPIEVTFLPLNDIVTATKLYNPDKFLSFNQQANEIFAGKREISKNEYEMYYDFFLIMKRIVSRSKP